MAMIITGFVFFFYCLLTGFTAAFISYVAADTKITNTEFLSIPSKSVFLKLEYFIHVIINTTYFNYDLKLYACHNS